MEATSSCFLGMKYEILSTIIWINWGKSKGLKCAFLGKINRK